MGMYTEFIFGAELKKDTPKYIIEGLNRVVETVIGQFQFMIEDKGLNELLWKGDKKGRCPERVPQLLFHMIALNYCRANNIDVNPEVDTGTGLIDFKFSSGYSHKIIVELKAVSIIVKAHKAQLINYLKATNKELQIVHSLAKWKRLALYDYKFPVGEGLYTDMNAIRRDEVADNIHSIYVDQWDWERVMTAECRTVEYLKSIVNRIYSAILRTEYYICETYPQIEPFLPENLTFIHAEQLLQRYPTLTPKEREDAICKEFGAVFIIGIGCTLSNGEVHDHRAPDYDDYSTVSPQTGLAGLNGDLLIWYPILERSIELSSMGIRVDKDALLHQLELQGKSDRKELYFHRRLLEGSLPLCIGGGIGQSRLCMILLHKAHVGETQSSIWPDDMRKQCKELGMTLI